MSFKHSVKNPYQPHHTLDDAAPCPADGEVEPVRGPGEALDARLGALLLHQAAHSATRQHLGVEHPLDVGEARRRAHFVPRAVAAVDERREQRLNLAHQLEAGEEHGVVARTEQRADALQDPYEMDPY